MSDVFLQRGTAPSYKKTNQSDSLGDRTSQHTPFWQEKMQLDRYLC
ncbi:unnamed protein product [Haemonchus placei]|uniref:Type I restriction endonuclease subunit M n=1 Tax=Haemonchus placei TaxID=6290 RepID=A0A0N4WJE5_HAEPC|nr:unnamed protein product [Haemonchus placei]